MPIDSLLTLDRRSFIVSPLAAAVAATTGDAAATTGGTVYTGDVIHGKKVVSALDISDLEPGRKHLLYFQGVQTPTGHHWYVSVIVARAAPRQAHHPDQRRSWRRDELDPHRSDGHGRARSGQHGGQRDGRSRHRPPGP